MSLSTGSSIPTSTPPSGSARRAWIACRRRTPRTWGNAIEPGRLRAGGRTPGNLPLCVENCVPSVYSVRNTSVRLAIVCATDAMTRACSNVVGCSKSAM